MNKSMPAKTLLKRFIPYYKPFYRVLALDLACAALTSACEIALPLIVRTVTDRAITDAQAVTITWVLRLALLYLALRIMDAGANFFMESQGHIMGAGIETNMRSDLFSHLQQLSFSYYNNTRIGQIMARITGDLFDVTEFAHHCPEEFLIAALKLTSAFIILSTMNLTLTLMVFAFMPFMFISMRFFNKRMRAAFAQCRGQVGEINAQVEDSLQGMRVVQSFTNEHIEKEKFGRGNNLFLRMKKRQYKYMAGFHTSSRLFDGIAYIVVVSAGALFLARGRITPGEYTAYLLYVATLLGSIRRIVDFTEQFQRGLTGIERFCQIMDAPFEIRDLPGAVDAQDVRGDVRFEHVSFRYGDDGREVLSGIDLTVKAGENVAVVGPSGSGKTTLCNLLPRFYDVTGGRITLDGCNIRDFTLKSLRGAIGMVQQEAYLFAGTVYENIAYGKPDASREQVLAAAKQAGADTFICHLPNGYDTYVGERGVMLSGGQKQRVSIARLFLKDPPVLILDEATSSLDNESERAVQQSLEALARGRTTFTIAHRLTTIRNADTIWVLTEKGIEEQGTHEDLMARGGLYASLYKMYSDKPACPLP